MLFLSRNTTFDDKLFYPHLGKSAKTVDEVLNHVTCASTRARASPSRGARDTGHVGLVVITYSQFLYRYKQTQSAKTRFRQAGVRQRVVNSLFLYLYFLFNNLLCGACGQSSIASFLLPSSCVVSAHRK